MIYSDKYLVKIKSRYFSSGIQSQIKSKYSRFRIFESKYFRSKIQLYKNTKIQWHKLQGPVAPKVTMIVNCKLYLQFTGIVKLYLQFTIIVKLYLQFHNIVFYMKKIKMSTYPFNCVHWMIRFNFYCIQAIWNVSIVFY